jgi:ADP-ribose pyrophosphatase YjhB (NUDIX family)
MKHEWLRIAKEIQSIAQAGLTYSTNQFDMERYQRLRDLSIDILQHYTDAPFQKIHDLFATETGYQTPKVDIRGVIFRDGKILMVCEMLDGKWTLPGGWAEVGYSPAENVVKEVWEEAGMHVVPERILAVFDKMKHTHPPDAFHVYKIFILCKDSGEEARPGMETTDAAWFGRDNIPPLSLLRITPEQIETMFRFYDQPEGYVLFD